MATRIRSADSNRPPVRAPGPAAFIPIALPAPVAAQALQGDRGGIIEIELVGGHRIRVDAAVDVKALKRVVDVLEGR